MQALKAELDTHKKRAEEVLVGMRARKSEDEDGGTRARATERETCQ